MGLGAAQLEVAALAMTAVLAIWLGLMVLTRIPTAPGRAFGFLALTLALWCSAVIVERLSSSAAAVSTGRSVEEFTTGVILPATAGLSLFVATEGRPSRWQLGLLALAYLANVGFALPGSIAQSIQIAIGPPQLSLGPIPGALLGWVRLASRLATMFAAAWVLLAAFRRTGAGSRRWQLGITFASVALAAAGGSLRILNEVLPTDAWIGLSLVAISMILVAAVVFSPGFFFASEVASPAFWTSLVVGLGLFLLIGVLLAVDVASRRYLDLDAPVAPVFALVVTIALYEPTIAWARSRLRGRTPAELARERLLRAIGPSAATQRPAGADLQPALARLMETLGLTGVAVVRPDGTIAASQGDLPAVVAGSSFPLIAGSDVMGELRVGTRRSGESFSADDETLIRLSAAYAAVALHAGRREDEQVSALTALAQDRAVAESAAERLLEAMVTRSPGAPGLRVNALGPLRVERAGEAIERWGGEKAGSRQALALFAFLFDRAERGVQKDEALELLWPDTEVERADVAFHRTLGGLRHTLVDDPKLAKRAIRFHNDRYRLDPAVIEWSDVAAFEGALAGAYHAVDAAHSLRLLEQARALYRGEYLDDCPFYGDSVFVEDRRAALRSRYADLLVELGSRYEAGGNRASAAAAFRAAAGVADEPNRTAEAGLARLAAGG